jgi:hypothetical protein
MGFFKKATKADTYDKPLGTKDSSADVIILSARKDNHTSSVSPTLSPVY